MTTDKKKPIPATLPATTENPVMRGGLLLPLADEETLVESFKRYVALKDKLLEESDYVWFAVYTAGSKTDRDGFTKREEAERKVAALRAKGIPADLEKRVKKSGFLKLGKAFGISTEIISERIDREKGYAEYTVRATAPNGQTKDKTGSCDRAERGKATAPFDSIMGTAVTRAEGRAIMALLGGETTAEEFEASPAPETPSQAAPAAPSAPEKVEPKPLTPEEERDIAERAKKAAEAASKPPSPPKLTPEERERLDALDAKFVRVKPAQPTSLYQLRGRMFAAAKDAGLSNEELKRGIVNKYRKESTKDLTESELLELIGILKKLAKDKDSPLAQKKS